MFLIAVALGSFIEVMQGILSFLGRSMELMDAVADSIGGALGIAAKKTGNEGIGACPQETGAALSIHGLRQFFLSS